MVTKNVNRLNKKQNYDLITQIKDLLEGDATIFKSWAEAETFFSTVLQTTVKRTNISSALEVLGVKPSDLVQNSHSSPLGQMHSRITALERRITDLENHLLGEPETATPPSVEPDRNEDTHKDHAA